MSTTEQERTTHTPGGGPDPEAARRAWFPELADDDAVRDLFDAVDLDRSSGPTVDLPVPWRGFGAHLLAADADPCDRFLLAVLARPVCHLEEVLRREEPTVDTDSLLPQLVGSLLHSVREVTLRPLITLLDEDRRAGVLVGRTPEDRYADFFDGLHTSAGLRRLVERFPGLSSLVLRLAERRVDVVAEILSHLRDDAHDLLAEVLDAPGGTLAPLVGLELGAGDGHRGGRAVSTLRFADDVRIVHKPRCLRVDRGFERVLDVVREATGERLPTPRFLVRDDHGWVEHVAGRMPQGPEEEHRYYHSLGVLTGVFHLLGATDMHFENVIAVGPDPVVVDLETLLHPRLRPADRYDADAGTHHALDALSRSVCAIGLLPLVMSRGNQPDSESVDVGASGFEPDALSPFRSLSVRNRGRDDMHVVLEARPLATSSSTPTLVTDEPGTPRQVAALIEGFELLHRWAEQHGAMLADLVDEAFAGTRVRYIHQPTYFYAQLLRLGTNPEVLGRADGRHTVMHRVGLRMPAAPAAVTAAEVRDLVEADVPVLFADPAARSLYTSRGEELPDLLEEPPLVSARRRILDADPTTRQAQTDLIRLAFINKYLDDPTRSYLEGPAPVAAPGARDGDREAEMLDTARLIGDRLLATRFRSTSPRFPTTWLGPLVSVTSMRLWRLGALQYDLYGGIPGVALYLARLSATTGDPSYGDAALEVAEPLADQLADLIDHGLAGSPGAWTGLGGTLYALLGVGDALGRDDLAETARRHGGALVDVAGASPETDVVGGRAGALGTLLALADGAPGPERDQLLAAAREVADGLIDAHPLLDGPDDGRVWHTGFAHGTAGVHPMLARLAEAAPAHAPRLLDAADRLVAAEDSLYSREDRQWWTSSERNVQSSAWCHGASGILLGRVLRLRHGAGDDADLSAVRRGVEVVRERGLGHNLGHCHGDAGNIDVLRLAAEVLGSDELAAEADAATDALYHRVVRRAATEPTDKYALSSSLMLGTSGAGYALLRRLTPRQTPGFLWLDRATGDRGDAVGQHHTERKGTP